MPRQLSEARESDVHSGRRFDSNHWGRRARDHFMGGLGGVGCGLGRKLAVVVVEVTGCVKGCRGNCVASPGAKS